MATTAHYSVATRLLPSYRTSPSPFDPSTSSSTPCVLDSDCGSSSGVGGMKNPELISSDEGSSSSEQTPAAALYSSPPPPPRRLPGAHPILNGVGAVPPVLPPSAPPLAGVAGPIFGQPPPSTANSNDLFVHVQVGETLSILVGSDVQHITGPATVRMVGESGISPSALPLHVPPGHMIHQIVDEQGVLRHLILSPEAPTTATRVAQNVAASMPSSSSTPSRPPAPPSAPPSSAAVNPPFYTVNRKWAPPKHNMPDLVVGNNDQPPHPPINYAQEALEIEPEDVERVREMLTRIQPLRIIRLTPWECDISWADIDTSEAAAPGGPFPQLDASEFTYTINLYEVAQPRARFVSQYRSIRTRQDGDAQNFVRLKQLIPNKDYVANVQAVLEERGIRGDSSLAVRFKTPAVCNIPLKPDPPTNIKVDVTGSDFICLSWIPPDRDNGAPVTGYAIYICRRDDHGEEASDKYMEVKETYVRVFPLRPGTSYRFRVAAINRNGESAHSVAVVGSTRVEGPPAVPQPPNVLQAGQRGVKVVWNPHPEHTYTLEMMDGSLPIERLVVLKDRALGSSAHVNDIASGVSYRFRLRAHNAEGESGPSEWTHFRLPVKDKVPIPSKPFVITQNKGRLEIGWKCVSSYGSAWHFHTEGCPEGKNAEWRTIHRGPNTSCYVYDDDLVFFRVQAVGKKHNSGEWSEVLCLSQLSPLRRPPQLAAPFFSSATKTSLVAVWQPPTELSLPASASLVYELRRVDGPYDLRRPDGPHQRLYAGPLTQFTIEGLRPQQYINVQVRCVIVDAAGLRLEGEWSPMAGSTTARDVPKCPHSLRLSDDRSELLWSHDDPSEMTFIVSRQEDSAPSTILGESSSTHFALAPLHPATTYTFTVRSRSQWGESDPSDPLTHVTPAEVPFPPEALIVEAESKSELLVRWNQPDCRGAEIKHYHVVVSHGETVATMSVEECEARVCDLQPDTSYRVAVSAENEVGTSEATSAEGRTKRPPPPPPTLECEAESTQLKLKWKPPMSSSPIGYRLVRVSDSNALQLIYEGEMCTAKVKNLSENTEYRFQIRSHERQTGSGAWSPVATFRTTLTPPPTIRVAPTATPVANGLYQLEWTNIIQKANPRGLFYRLQVVDSPGNKWTTVYEGSTSSYTLRVAGHQSAIQVRVLCVRPDGDGFLTGAPSPVVHISNQASPSCSQVETVDSSSDRCSAWQQIKKMMADHSVATLTVIAFVFCSFTMAIFLESLFGAKEPEVKREL